jgi:hypothetical protein
LFERRSKFTHIVRAAFATVFCTRSDGKKGRLPLCRQKAVASEKMDGAATGLAAPGGKKMHVVPTPL